MILKYIITTTVIIIFFSGAVIKFRGAWAPPPKKESKLAYAHC